jgi:hypothetical protein
MTRKRHQPAPRRLRHSRGSTGTDIKSVANEESADAVLSDLVQDYAQALMDVVVSENKVLEHIPVIKTLTAAVTAVKSVRDQILLQKLARFVAALAEVPADQRRAMIGKLEAEPGYKRKVGAHLVELLDRVDSHRKPLMIGEVFAAYLRGQIDATMFQRLLGAIERLSAIDIDAVRKFLSSPNPDLGEITRESIQALTNAGMAWTSTGPVGGRIGYTPNEICRMFVVLDLDVKSVK